LMEAALSLFWDEPLGGFFFTAEGEERLFIRPKEVFDHPLPSGNGIAAQVLVRLAAVTGEPRWADLAGRTLGALSPWMTHAPQGTQSLILATAMHLEARSS